MIRFTSRPEPIHDGQNRIFENVIRTGEPPADFVRFYAEAGVQVTSPNGQSGTIPISFPIPVEADGDEGVEEAFAALPALLEKYASEVRQNIHRQQAQKMLMTPVQPHEAKAMKNGKGGLRLIQP
jgi:hypothetical protein